MRKVFMDRKIKYLTLNVIIAKYVYFTVFIRVYLNDSTLLSYITIVLGVRSFSVRKKLLKIRANLFRDVVIKKLINDQQQKKL